MSIAVPLRPARGGLDRPGRQRGPTGQRVSRPQSRLAPQLKLIADDVVLADSAFAQGSPVTRPVAHRWPVEHVGDIRRPDGDGVRHGLVPLRLAYESGKPLAFADSAVTAPRHLRS